MSGGYATSPTESSFAQPSSQQTRTQSRNSPRQPKKTVKLHTPAMDQYEHNPIRWWETSRATIGEVLSKLSPTDRSRIAAIGITH